MHRRIISLVLQLILLAYSINAISAASVPISREKLYQIHSAVFDTFNPFTDEEQNTTVVHLLSEAREASFLKLAQVPQLKAALFLLDHLHLLHHKSFVRFYHRVIAKDHAEAEMVSNRALKSYKEFVHSLSPCGHRLSILDLRVDDRLRLFSALINSDVNLLRLIGFYLRAVYTQALYEGSLGEQISQNVDREPKVASIVPALPSFATHLRYCDKHKHLKGKLDAIIVGSGAAGAVAAHELQQKGLKLLVLESGPMVIPGAFDTTSDMRLMEGGIPRLAEDGSIALLNGATVGGGPTINLDMSFPPTRDHVRHRFHEWHKQGLIPADLWTDEEIDEAYEWVKSIFAPRDVSLDEVNENNRILMRGAKALGLPYRLYQLNTYAPDQSPHEVYSKKSSFEKLLLPAMLADKNPATLLSDCRVTRVLIKHGKAVGVECLYQPKIFATGFVHDPYGFGIKPGTLIKIYAKNVILAAGNLGTSAVLLKSDIKNSNIGKGYVAHPFFSLMGRFDHPIYADRGEPSTILVDHFMQTDEHPDRPGFLIETGLGRLSLWALLSPGAPQQVKEAFAKIDHVGGFSVMQTDLPNDKNRVTVDRKGNIKVHYHLADGDRKNLIEGIKTAVKMLFGAGALEVSFNSFEYPLFQEGGLEANTLTPDMDIDDIFSRFELQRNKNSLLGAHMMGGNKIGMSKKTSVVNKNYQVWDVPNLYVIDASVFPGSVGANPMNTIYTCAKYFADRFTP